MVVMGKKVVELGDNPKVEDLVVGERYLLDDISKVEGYHFYMDNVLYSNENDSKGVDSGVLVDISSKLLSNWRNGGNRMLINTTEGDYIIE